MLIVAGHLVVAADVRDTYVAGCRTVVEQARAAPGCLDFTITADTVDPGRVNVYELWATEAELLAFRGSGVDDDQGAMIESASVRRYEVSGEGPP